MTCLKIDWIEVLFKPCLVYMFLVVRTQLAVLKEKLLLKSVVFSQKGGLPIISNFVQQKLLTDKIHAQSNIQCVS